MKALISISLFSIVLFLGSCSKDKVNSLSPGEITNKENSLSETQAKGQANLTYSIKLTGIIIKPTVGLLYGTHVLKENNGGKYALRSGLIDLSWYMKGPVNIYGVKIEGYPKEGFGMKYIDVIKITPTY